MELNTKQKKAFKEATSKPLRRKMTVVAVAGSGKTTLLRAIAASESIPTVYLVADSATRREAQARFPSHVVAHTPHSLAYQAIIASDPTLKYKLHKASGGKCLYPASIIKRIAVDRGEIASRAIVALNVRDLVQGFENSGDTQLKAAHLPDERLPPLLVLGSDISKKAAYKERVCRYAREFWLAMIEDPECPISHNTYLKWLQLDKPVFKFERWLCDEFQDANPVVADIISNQPDSQVIRVGDPSQQIYSWRGAINALETDEADGKQFTLNESFRFGSEIGRIANTVLVYAGYTHVIDGVGGQREPLDSERPITVIARNNISLAHLALRAIDKGQRVRIVGRISSITSLLHDALAIYNGKPSHSPRPDLVGIEAWSQLKELADLAASPTIRLLCRLIESRGGELKHSIHELEKAAVRPECNANRIFTTVHQAKGSEWDQVWLAGDLAIPQKLLTERTVKNAFLADSEAFNALYIGITRARKSVGMSEAVRQSLETMRQQLAVNTTPGIVALS